MNLDTGTSEMEQKDISLQLDKELKTKTDESGIKRLPSWFVLTQEVCDETQKFRAFDTKTVFEKKEKDEKTVEDFSLLQKRFLICAIDEMINQLVVFGAGKAQYPARVNFQRANVKYKEPRKLTLYNPQTNKLVSETEPQIREIKLQRERELVIKILSLTRDELIANSSIHCIYAYLAMEHEARSENILINKSYIENKSKLQELKWLKWQMEKDTSGFVTMQRERLAKKRASIQQIRKKAVAEMLYNYRWQEARYDQNKEAIKKQKRKVKRELDLYEHKIDTENRVHEEIKKYIQISVQQILADVEEWTKLYDKDVDEIDGKILRIEALMEDARQRLQLMDEITEEKERQIAELLIEKEERDKVIAEENRKLQCVIKIQSWWRGIMVRWEFGEYQKLMKDKYKKIKIPKEKKKKKKKKEDEE